MLLLELPYDFSGLVFRSEMPYSTYDPLGACSGIIKWERIEGAVEVPEQVLIVELFAEGRSGPC